MYLFSITGLEINSDTMNETFLAMMKAVNENLKNVKMFSDNSILELSFTNLFAKVACEANIIVFMA